MPPTTRTPSSRHLVAAVRLIATISLGLPAAWGQAPPNGTWKSTRLTRGDTTVGGAVWADGVRLVEEVRIGRETGGSEYEFGALECVEPLADGGVAVFDGSVPALRVYDPTGRFVRTLGGAGAGPGEYRDACLGLIADPDGTLWMYDPRNARLNHYGADGKPLPPVRVPAGLFAPQSLIRDARGALFVKVLLAPPEPDRDWKFGFTRVYPESARRDTIPVPEVPGPASEDNRFGPQKFQVFSPLGYFVTGYSDRYAVDLRQGPKAVLRIERRSAPVAVGAEERADWDQFLAVWRARLSGSNKDRPVPKVVSPKAPYRDLLADRDGRIWVAVATVAVKDPNPPEPRVVNGVKVPVITWIEPPVYDVFRPDGALLGRLTLPLKGTVRASTGDVVWAVLRGGLDESYVVRYRIKG